MRKEEENNSKTENTYTLVYKIKAKTYNEREEKMYF